MFREIKKKIKSLFKHEDSGETICFEWSENENAQYERFAVEHFEECGVPTPWMCFKYANNKWYKKMVCPACGAEYIIKNNRRN